MRCAFALLLGKSRKTDSLPAAKSAEVPLRLVPPKAAFAPFWNPRKTDSLPATQSAEIPLRLVPPKAAFALLSLCSIGFLSAQSPITGPSEGFTFDAPTKSFRAVIGSLGSASLGRAILEGFDYGSVAPRRSHGIAFQEGRCLVVSDLNSSQASTAVVPGTFTVPEDIAWSGDGSIAILYSRTGNWIRTLTGFPGSVNAGASLDIPTQGGLLSAVATDLRGQRIAIGVTGETGGVFLFQVADDQSLMPLLSLAKPIALAFNAAGNTLYALDGSTSNVSQVSMTDLTWQVWPAGGLDDPIAISPAMDLAGRSVVYVAGRSDRRLLTYDAATQQLAATVTLGFQPTVIRPLGISSFVLSSRFNSDDPLWSFKSSQEPAVYFIPAMPLVSGEEQSR